MTATKVVPFSFKDHQIRTIQLMDQPFFHAQDVCNVLEIKNGRDVVRRALDEDERLMSEIPTGGQARRAWFVNESGLYVLILRSNKPEAKAFRKWVTSEVLPAIRKTGMYATPQVLSRLQNFIHDYIERAAVVVGSRDELARQLDVSTATVSQMYNNNWEQISAEMFWQVFYGCRHLLTKGVTPGAKVMDLLMRVEDAEVRMGLFNAWKNKRS